MSQKGLTVLCHYGISLHLSFFLEKNSIESTFWILEDFWKFWSMWMYLVLFESLLGQGLDQVALTMKLPTVMHVWCYIQLF